MEKYWTTIDGDEIEYTKLEDSHLLNILKFIKRRAKEGIMDGWGGLDGEGKFEGDAWELSEEEALKKLDYEGLKEEAKRRNLC